MTRFWVDAKICRSWFAANDCTKYVVNVFAGIIIAIPRRKTTRTVKYSRVGRISFHPGVTLWSAANHRRTPFVKDDDPAFSGHVSNHLCS
jgi:hypothetical protein